MGSFHYSYGKKVSMFLKNVWVTLKDLDVSELFEEFFGMKKHTKSLVNELLDDLRKEGVEVKPGVPIGVGECLKIV